MLTPEQMEFSRLRTDNVRLKRENEIQKIDGVLRKGHAVKYAWIDEQCNDCELGELSSVLEVSVSGCQSWTREGAPDRKQLTDAQILALIRVSYEELKSAYGGPRMVRELRGRGFSATKERDEPLTQSTASGSTQTAVCGIS